MHLAGTRISLVAIVTLGLLVAAREARPVEPAVRISPLDRERLTVQLSKEPPQMDPAYRALLEYERRFLNAGGRSMPALADAYNQFGCIHVEFETAKAREDFEKENNPGVFAFSRVDRFADMFVSGLAAFEKVERHAGVRWIDLGGVSKVPNPGLRAVGAEPAGGTARNACLVGAAPPPEDVIRGGDKRIGGLTGKGVVLVIIDTGADFRNSDFIAEGDRPTSRILYYWDTLIYLDPKFTFGAELPPIKSPGGRPMGIVYTQDGLTKDLRDGRRQVPLYDVNGHGTRCAGVAAGNGRNARNNPAAAELKTPCMGAATEADLIVVRIAWTREILYGFMLGAIIDWVEQKALTDERLKGRPIVYSCSWGSDSGDRAGGAILERQIDARFPPDRKGRAICIAAGNDGRAAHHGRAFADGPQQRLVWETRSANGRPGREGHSLSIYYGGAGEAGDLAVEYVPPDSVTGREREQLKAAVLKELRNKTFRHNVLGGLVTDVCWLLPTGRHELRFTNSKGGTLRPQDAYVQPGADNAKAEFVEKSREYGKQIGFPGASSNAITVGSYDWNSLRFDENGQLEDPKLAIGELSAYSNPGPVRVGAAVKPDIVAPGQYWLVSEPDVRQLIGPRKYGSFNGTSAATPYVAGLVALMMQKKPTITAGDIKQLLATHATKDLGKLLPKDRQAGWGNGKLDAAAVVRIIQSITD